MANLQKRVEELEKRVSKLEREIKEIKAEGIERAYAPAVIFPQFLEVPLTDLWNRLIDIGYEIEKSEYVDEETVAIFEGLFRQIRSMYRTLKGSYLEPRAKKVYEKALEIKKILDKKPRKPTVKFILPK